MDLGLKGRNAIVTGASSGIGRAIAKGLAAEGVRVVVSGRREKELQSLAQEIERDGGAKPAIVVHDAMDDGYVEAIAGAAQAVGPVGILVNNAGGSRAFGKDATEQQWEEAFTLNFTRHRQLANRLLQQMV